MFQVTCQKGNMYAVIDNEDGVVEWLDKETLMGYAENGVDIVGVQNGTIIPSMCFLPADKCNWADGQNIFKVAECFTCTASGLVQFRAGKKVYKCKILTGGDGWFLRFTSNVVVSLREIEEISSLRFDAAY